MAEDSLRPPESGIDGEPAWLREAAAKRNRWAAFTDNELYTLGCASGSMIGIGSNARHLDAEIRAEMERREAEGRPA